MSCPSMPGRPMPDQIAMHQQYQGVQHSHQPLIQAGLPQQQQINQPQYSRQIDPYSIPGDSYATVDNAFSKTPSMMEFQQKIATDNPLYPPTDGPSNVPHPIKQDQSTQSINKNIQNLFESSLDYSNSPNRKNIDKVIESVYSPKNPRNIKYPKDEYISDEYESELLEGYDQVGDNIELRSEMSTPRLFLWILLAVMLIYGAYYLYNKNLKNSSSPKYDFNPASIFNKNTFRTK